MSEALANPRLDRKLAPHLESLPKIISRLPGARSARGTWTTPRRTPRRARQAEGHAEDEGDGVDEGDESESEPSERAPPPGRVREPRVLGS